MEDFIFHEGIIPSRYSFSFTESLFNQYAHRQLQSKSNWHSFFILNQKDNTVDGAIHFNVQEGIAKSPLKATYGGFDLREGIQKNVVYDFVQFVESQLVKTGTVKISIKLPLRISKNNDHDLVENILLSRQFQVSLKEAGCIAEVGESFYEKIHRSQKWCLRKSIERHLEFIHPPISELENVYFFIEQCHQQKNYKLSMSFQEISDLVRQFPERVLLFIVKDKDELIAASICIRVTDKVLYDFCQNHNMSATKFSPIIFLIKGIHDYCHANHIPFLDFGTSMKGNEVNTGLLEFKLRLGADYAVKYSFEKNCI